MHEDNDASGNRLLTQAVYGKADTTSMAEVAREVKGADASEPATLESV